MTHFSHITPRRLATLAVATAALIIPSAAQAASAPTVEVDVADRAITVQGADDLGRGPVRLHLSGESLDDTRTVSVVELKRSPRGHRLHDSAAVRGRAIS